MNGTDAEIKEKLIELEVRKIAEARFIDFANRVRVEQEEYQKTLNKGISTIKWVGGICLILGSFLFGTTLIDINTYAKSHVDERILDYQIKDELKNRVSTSVQTQIDLEIRKIKSSLQKQVELEINNTFLNKMKPILDKGVNTAIAKFDSELAEGVNLSKIIISYDKDLKILKESLESTINISAKQFNALELMMKKLKKIETAIWGNSALNLTNEDLENGGQRIRTIRRIRTLGESD